MNKVYEKMTLSLIEDIKAPKPKMVVKKKDKKKAKEKNADIEDRPDWRQLQGITDSRASFIQQVKEELKKEKPKTKVKKDEGHPILGDIFNHMNLGDLQQELDKLTSVPQPKKPKRNGNGKK